MQADIVVLAAGRGRRARSATPKPLLPLAGAPLLAHVLRAAAALRPRSVCVVAPPNSPIADYVAKNFPKARVAIQQTPQGTAHALACGLAKRPAAAVLALCADTPLLSPPLLRRLLRPVATGAPAFLTFAAANAGAYGRVVRAAGGQNLIARIVEAKDASAGERKINEVFAGALAAPGAWLAAALPRIGKKNAAGERYLTDLAAMAAQSARPAVALLAPPAQCLGVNTMADLHRAEAAWRAQAAAALLQKGVVLADAARVDVRGQVAAGRGVFIDINAVFVGDVRLAAGCHIGANCVIENSRIGRGAVVHPFSHLCGARVGANCQVGPFARLRPGSVLASAAKVGNFVEVKNSALGRASKAGHLAYLGDARVGAGANIGAGVITCNYDGKNKNKTNIGAGAFVGSNAQLVAPVRVGRGAYIAAGATISKNVPPRRLAIARARQVLRPLPKAKGKK